MRDILEQDLNHCTSCHIRETSVTHSLEMFGDFLAQCNPRRANKDLAPLFYTVYTSIANDDDEMLADVLSGNEDFAINGRFQDGWTFMAVATSRRSVRCMRFLDKIGLSINYARDGESTVTFAVVNVPEFVRGAIEAGANPNVRNHNGTTAIFYCCSTELAETLLECGASAHTVTDCGCTAAAIPLNGHMPTLLDTYLRHGLGDVPALGNGFFPAHACACSNFTQGILRVIRHGCDLDVEHEGLTPLDYAHLNNNRAVGVELVAAGARASNKISTAWIKDAIRLIGLRRAALGRMRVAWMHICSATPQNRPFYTLRKVTKVVSLSDDALVARIILTPLEEIAHNAYNSGVMDIGCRYMAERVYLKFATEAVAEAHMKTVPLLEDKSYVAIRCVAKLGECVRHRQEAEARVAKASARLEAHMQLLEEREAKLRKA